MVPVDLITTWTPGTLYQMNENHHLFSGDFQNNDLARMVFLCTKPMVAHYGDKNEQAIVESHVLISVDDGGLWACDPDRREYQEVPL